MTDFKFIDSSIWISYLLSDEEVKTVIDKEDGLATSVLSLFEINKKLQRLGYSKAKINQALSLIKQRSILCNVDEETVNVAIDFSKTLAIVDAILYATSQLNDFKLITKDNDFRGLKDVVIL